MSLDGDLRHSPLPEARHSAVGLGRDLRRAGLAPWTLWLGYLSLGGTMTFDQVNDALHGSRPVTADELYLLVQARNT